MFHLNLLKNRFRMRVSEYNKIVEYLNNLCGGFGINMKRPDNPSASSPPMVEIDRSALLTIMQQSLSTLTPSNPSNPVVLTSGEKGDVGTDSNDTTHDWTASTGANARGLKIFLPCKSESSGVNGQIHWREFTLTPDGRVYHVATESGTPTQYYANPPS